MNINDFDDYAEIQDQEYHRLKDELAEERFGECPDE